MYPLQSLFLKGIFYCSRFNHFSHKVNVDKNHHYPEIHSPIMAFPNNTTI